MVDGVTYPLFSKAHGFYHRSPARKKKSDNTNGECVPPICFFKNFGPHPAWERGKALATPPIDVKVVTLVTPMLLTGISSQPFAFGFSNTELDIHVRSKEKGFCFYFLHKQYVSPGGQGYFIILQEPLAYIVPQPWRIGDCT